MVLTQDRRRFMHIAEAVLDTLSEAVLVFDLSLEAVAANRAAYQLLPISREELAGKSIDQLLPGDRGTKKLKARLRRVASQEGLVETIRIKSIVPEQDPKYLLLCARRVQFRNDLPDMILVEFADITREVDGLHQVRALNEALVNQREELQSLNRELDSFTSCASHDLRTPLRFTNKIGRCLLEEHGAQLPAGAIEKTWLDVGQYRGNGKSHRGALAIYQSDARAHKKTPRRSAAPGARSAPGTAG